MTRILFFSASLLGAAAIFWTGADFIGSNSLAFAITLVIGVVFVIGLVELVRFRGATASLERALSHLPGDEDNALEDWLSQLHPSLVVPTRLRIGGQRVGLPAPVLTPYLVGLLVMLGLLGTFAGMVETLSGAVLALQGSTELEAIRNGLAAPIQGLGLAFGTSVAGVAASAMLGLNAALCRRERLLIAQELDRVVADHLRQYSLAYQQQETFSALRTQAEALPAVAGQLGAISQQLASMSERLEQRLVDQQAQHMQAQQAQFSELAGSVADSLKASLQDSGRLAGDSLRPVLSEAMAGIGRDIQASQQQQLDQQSRQIAQLSEQLGNDTRDLGQQLLQADQSRFEQWRTQLQALQASSQEQQTDSQARFTQALADTSTALQQQLADNARTVNGEFSDMANQLRPSLETAAERFGALLSSTEELVAARQAAEQTWQRDQEQRLVQLSETLASELGQLREAEGERAAAAVARLADLEAVVTDHLGRLGSALEDPMLRLIESAAETPAAAAEVIAALRGEISQSLARDNTLLAERSTLLEQLNTLSGSLADSTTGQREAMEQMVSNSAGVLEDIGHRFTDQLASQAQQITDISADVAGSASEMAGLGEAFSTAVEIYNQSNEQLMANLARIETSLNESTARSDDQMGYYVAQAREIIDQSMSSQRAIIEDLRQASRQGDLLAAEAS